MSKAELILSNIEGLVFAVVDGAHIENLALQLAAANLSFRPLYVSEDNEGTSASGPHLVETAHLHEREAVVSIAQDKPAVVWWAWPDEPDAPAKIFDHLRRLNLVEIPTDRYDARGADLSSTTDEDATSPEFEPVLLRHADSSILLSLLPVLDLEQRERFLGNASAIILSDDDGQAYQARRQSTDGSAQAGPLRIRPQQYEALRNRRGGILLKSTEKYLDRVADKQTASMERSELRLKIREWIVEGQEFGFRSERAFWKWSYLQILSAGGLSSDEDVTAYLKNADRYWTADRRVDQLMSNAVKQLRGTV